MCMLPEGMKKKKVCRIPCYAATRRNSFRNANKFLCASITDSVNILMSPPPIAIFDRLYSVLVTAHEVVSLSY